MIIRHEVNSYYPISLTSPVICISHNDLLYKFSNIIIMVLKIFLEIYLKSMSLKPILCNVLKEFCAIRDDITTCDIASITDIIAMIEDIMY